MPTTKIKQIICVHVIDRDGNDHYPVFMKPKKAMDFVMMMRHLQFPAEIV